MGSNSWIVRSNNKSSKGSGLTSRVVFCILEAIAWLTVVFPSNRATISATAGEISISVPSWK